MLKTTVSKATASEEG